MSETPVPVPPAEGKAIMPPRETDQIAGLQSFIAVNLPLIQGRRVKIERCRVGFASPWFIRDINENVLTKEGEWSLNYPLLEHGHKSWRDAMSFVLSRLDWHRATPAETTAADAHPLPTWSALDVPMAHMINAGSVTFHCNDSQGGNALWQLTKAVNDWCRKHRATPAEDAEQKLRGGWLMAAKKFSDDNARLQAENAELQRERDAAQAILARPLDDDSNVLLNRCADKEPLSLTEQRELYLWLEEARESRDELADKLASLRQRLALAGGERTAREVVSRFEIDTETLEITELPKSHSALSSNETDGKSFRQLVCESYGPRDVDSEQATEISQLRNRLHAEVEKRETAERDVAHWRDCAEQTAAREKREREAAESETAKIKAMFDTKQLPLDAFYTTPAQGVAVLFNTLEVVRCERNEARQSLSAAESTIANLKLVLEDLADRCAGGSEDVIAKMLDRPDNGSLLACVVIARKYLSALTEAAKQ